MKKTLKAILALTLAMGILSGCGAPAETPASSSAPAPAQSSEVAAPSEAPAASEAPVSAWEMKKEPEYVVPASPGGGSDISARVISEIVQKNSLAPKNLMVVNKPGGACAVGYNYVGSKKGDPYTLLSLHSGNLIVSCVNDWEQKYNDLTDIIAIMAYDDQTLCVNAESPYKDIEALLEAAKKAPGTLKFGSDQRGNSSQLCYELIKKYAGADFNYVQYDSSGDVATALLGGHVDVAILNPGEGIAQVEVGKFIPIATFAPERLTGKFADAPTFLELGYPEIILREYRGISGAKGMPAEALAFYEEMAKKVTETDAWKKDYLEANCLSPVFMGNKDATAFVEKDMETVMQTFKEVGYFDELKKS